jgi:hypothetical protein
VINWYKIRIGRIVQLAIINEKSKADNFVFFSSKYVFIPEYILQIKHQFAKLVIILSAPFSLAPDGSEAEIKVVMTRSAHALLSTAIQNNISPLYAQYE